MLLLFLNSFQVIIDIKQTILSTACTPLISPMMGNLSCTDANKISSVCTYDCGQPAGDVIYTLEGPREVTCLKDDVMGASWSDVPSICGGSLLSKNF